MNSRDGFTVLEATIAMAIVGIVAVASLAEFATEIRVGTRAVEARMLQALVQDRISALEVAPVELLYHLPDSLEAGAFPAPFTEFAWKLTIRPVHGVENLVHARVVVSSRSSQLAASIRLLRPARRMERPRP